MRICPCAARAVWATYATSIRAEAPVGPGKGSTRIASTVRWLAVLIPATRRRARATGPTGDSLARYHAHGRKRESRGQCDANQIDRHDAPRQRRSFAPYRSLHRATVQPQNGLGISSAGSRQALFGSRSRRSAAGSKEGSKQAGRKTIRSSRS